MTLYKKLVLTGLMFIFFLISGTGVYASESPFSVFPVLPDDQDEGIQSYISLSDQSGEFDQIISFKLKNNSSEDQTIDIVPVNAYTSTQGRVEYLPNPPKNSSITDENYEFIKYSILGDDQVTLKQGETKVIDVNVKASIQSGTLLGGVSFISPMKSETSGQFKVEHELNQLIAVVLNGPFTNETLMDNGEPIIESNPSYFEIKLPLEQKSPYLLTDVTFEYDVSYKGERLFGSLKELDVAPKTKALFKIPFDYDEILQDEEYLMDWTLTYSGPDGKKHKIKEQSKMIYSPNNKSDLDTDDIKRPTVTNNKDKEKNENFPWLVLILIIVILGVAISYAVYMKKAKKHKKPKKEKSNNGKSGEKNENN